MVRAAKERGLQEVAITDHSHNKMFRGFRRRNFDKYLGEVESSRCEMPVLVGFECNMTSVSGDIDLSPEMEKKLDIVLFGVHVAIVYSPRAFFTFFLPNVFFNLLRYRPGWLVRRNTKLVKRVIEKNKIDIWTHPNLYFKVDVVEIAEECAKRGTLIELNSKRISFRPVDFERMAEIGCKFIINSDAHSSSRVGDTTRAEEFLKSCDYNPRDIVNLNTTYTLYRNPPPPPKEEKHEIDTDGTDKNGSAEVDAPAKRKGWFRRRK